MIHEPECPVVSGRYDTAHSCDECNRLRAAYQRGREDAAQAVASRLAELLTTSPAILASQEAFDAFVDAANSIVAAAARGDGAE